eukprot:1431024-Rhodomonas_salina.3
MWPPSSPPRHVSHRSARPSPKHPHSPILGSALSLPLRPVCPRQDSGADGLDTLARYSLSRLVWMIRSLPCMSFIRALLRWLIDPALPCLPLSPQTLRG